MRHAKSAWDASVASDHARPLNERGRADAPRIATALVDRGWSPQLVVASDSARTTETWACMADIVDAASQRAAQVDVLWRRSLYLAGLNAALDALYPLHDQVRSVLLLGHNPGWEKAVCDLSGEQVRLTTGNAAMFEVDASAWANVGVTSRWRLVDVLRPKSLATR